jgi:hypothetical protein
MHFFAQEYSKALGRTITFQDIPVEPWRDELLQAGLAGSRGEPPGGDGRPASRGAFDPLSDDVLTLTGQRPLNVQELVRMNAAAFTALAKAKEA